MKKTTELYDGQKVLGFIKRKDGFWWVRDKGELTSMSDSDGARVERLVNTVFLNQRTPFFSECVSYIVASIKHRVGCLFYIITKKICQ